MKAWKKELYEKGERIEEEWKGLMREWEERRKKKEEGRAGIDKSEKRIGELERIWEKEEIAKGGEKKREDEGLISGAMKGWMEELKKKEERMEGG
jgi:hypothetical protein